METKLKVVKTKRNQELKGPEFLSTGIADSVMNLHKSMKEYKPTPLVDLSSLAKTLGVKKICVKDESKRFGLNAFKCLGGVYALCNVISEKFKLDIGSISFNSLKKPEFAEKIKEMVFVTATDGNHGKGIAWAASQLGCKSIVYMPKGSSEFRVHAIREASNYTSDVIITEQSYDDTVRHAANMANENGWYLVQDTSWDGYELVPTWIAQGYMTMVKEAVDQLENYGYGSPSHVFLQAGVGCMAGSVQGYLVNRYGENYPITSIVEAATVACIYDSAYANDGNVRIVSGVQDTIMAGLNCGEPCSITWPILRDFASYYFAAPDFVAARGMRILGNPIGNDERIISGESGAVTLGLVSLLLERSEFSSIKEDLGLNEDSVILLFNTEGDTEPKNYRAIVHDGLVSTPEEKLEISLKDYTN